MNQMDPLDILEEKKFLALKYKALGKPPLQCALVYREVGKGYFDFYRNNTPLEDGVSILIESFGLYVDAGDPSSANLVLNNLVSLGITIHDAQLKRIKNKFLRLQDLYVKQYSIIKNHIGKIGSDFGSLDEGIARRFIHETPGNYLAYWILYRTLERQGKIEGAILALNEALELAPRDYKIRAMKVFLLVNIDPFNSEIDGIFKSHGEHSMEICAAYFCALILRLMKTPSRELIKKIEYTLLEINGFEYNYRDKYFQRHIIQMEDYYNSRIVPLLDSTDNEPVLDIESIRNMEKFVIETRLSLQLEKLELQEALS